MLRPQQRAAIDFIRGTRIVRPHTFYRFTSGKVDIGNERNDGALSISTQIIVDYAGAANQRGESTRNEKTLEGLLPALQNSGRTAAWQMLQCCGDSLQVWVVARKRVRLFYPGSLGAQLRQ